MPRFPRAAGIAGTALLLLALFVAPAGPVQAAGSRRASLAASAPVPSFTPSVVQRLLEEINRIRWEHGQIPPLKHNPALERAAQSHSQEMAQRDFFGHQGADNSSPWDRIEAAGYSSWYVLAENIAAGYQNPADVVKAWMVSPQHRENMLNPELHEAGIGYVYEPGDTLPGGTWGYQYYWTLDMGSCWDAYPLIIAGESYSTTTRTVSIYFYGADWASELRLSSDGSNWSAWQPYRSLLTWELPPGNGLKRVYGQLRDASGDILQSEDEIVLDEPPRPPPLPEVATFVLLQGDKIGRPPRYRVWFSDPTGQTRAWRASWDQDWLRLSAEGAIVPGRVFLVLDKPAGLLEPGTYTAILSIRGQAIEIKVPVRLLVFPRLFSVFLPFTER